MITREIIISSFFNWFQQWIGKHFIRKTRLRYQYKERLNEIVNGFGEAMSGHRRTSSMTSVISDIIRITDDIKRKPQLNCQLRMVALLESWYSTFKDSPNSMNPKCISQCVEQFARILYEIHAVVNQLFQEITGDEKVRNNLKINTSSYPNFEKIYNKTINDFEQLCKEASRNLKDEFKEYQFLPLPRP